MVVVGYGGGVAMTTAGSGIEVDELNVPQGVG